MTKILVIGSNGQLGSELKKKFTHNDNFFFVGKETIDVLNQEKLKNFIELLKPNLIINCVAYTNVIEAENNLACFDLNHIYVRKLAEICHKNHIFLIHFSTDYVFDGKKESPYSELDNPNPQNNYGKSKLLGDLAIQKIMDNYLIIRCSWIFSGTSNCFITKIYNQLKEKDSIKVDSISLGNPLYVGDLADVIYKFIKKFNKNKFNKNDSGIYNFCSMPITTWHGLSEKFCNFLQDNEKINKKINILQNNKINNHGLLRPKNTSLDTTKIKSYLGIEDYFWEKKFENVVKNLAR